MELTAHSVGFWAIRGVVACGPQFTGSVGHVRRRGTGLMAAVEGAVGLASKLRSPGRARATGIGAVFAPEGVLQGQPSPRPPSRTYWLML